MPAWSASPTAGALRCRPEAAGGGGCAGGRHAGRGGAPAGWPRRLRSGAHGPAARAPLWLHPNRARPLHASRRGGGLSRAGQPRAGGRSRDSRRGRDAAPTRPRRPRRARAPARPATRCVLAAAVRAFVLCGGLHSPPPPLRSRAAASAHAPRPVAGGNHHRGQRPWRRRLPGGGGGRGRPLRARGQKGPGSGPEGRPRGRDRRHRRVHGRRLRSAAGLAASAAAVLRRPQRRRRHWPGVRLVDRVAGAGSLRARRRLPPWPVTPPL